MNKVYTLFKINFLYQNAENYTVAAEIINVNRKKQLSLSKGKTNKKTCSFTIINSIFWILF